MTPDGAPSGSYRRLKRLLEEVCFVREFGGSVLILGRMKTNTNQVNKVSFLFL